MSNQYQVPQYKNLPQDPRNLHGNFHQSSQVYVQPQGGQGNYHQGGPSSTNGYSSPASQGINIPQVYIWFIKAYAGQPTAILKLCKFSESVL